MPKDNRTALRFLRPIFLLVVAASLSACAGRPRPMEPSQPYNVTEVRVMADSIEDFGFADRLQERLESTVGRATADVGQTSSLRVVVRDNRLERSPVSFLGGVSRSVSVDLTLTDPETGRLLRRRSLSATTSNFNGSDAEPLLIARLNDDIRSLLGLSGYAPYPVVGAKRDVALPSINPDRVDLDDIALRAADPLLNGTVTPTTVTLDVETDSKPTVDYTRPLLGETRQSVSSAPAARPELPKATPVAAAGSGEVRTAASAEDDPLDQPCIITLDNDCSDPDSR